MSWQNRTTEAAYTSPSGTRQTFDYENVSSSFEKKTSAFEFPDADGTFIQDLGRSGRRYPLRLFFHGNDYDQEVAAFEALLEEQGTGKLEHPIYGSKSVVPFGAVRRRDDLKTASNQAIVEVTFWETIDVVYPAAQGDPASAVRAAVDEYNTAQAGEFAENISLSSTVEQNLFKNAFETAASVTKNVLQTTADVARFFDSLIRGVDALVSQPLALAQQCSLAIQQAGSSAGVFAARSQAYAELLGLITTGESATNQTENSFRTSDLYASGYVSGVVLTAINSTFDNRRQAIDAAASVAEQFDTLVAWRDSNLEQLGILDTGGSYQQLQEAVAVVTGALVQISFTLPQERTVTLSRNRTIVDLCAELYGEVDSRLDFLINTNNLSGSEIIELPKGREIVYYI